MKVTLLLRNERAALKALFAEYQKTGHRNQYGKQRFFNAIHKEIRLQSHMTTDVFYTELASTSSTVARALAATGEQQLRSIEARLNSMNARDPNFDASMSALLEDVNRLIELEEEQIFVEARKILPEYKLESLGLEIEDRRRLLRYLAA